MLSTAAAQRSGNAANANGGREHKKNENEITK